MAKLTLTYENLYIRVSNYLALTAPGVAPTSTDLTTCQDIVHRAIRQFLYPIDERYGTPHRWSFIEKFLSIQMASSQWKYNLPVDFSDMVENPTFSGNTVLPPLEKVSPQTISEFRNRAAVSGWPEYYAIAPSVYDPTTGTSYELWVYPTPGGTYWLQSFYCIDPVKLSATTDMAIGPISVAEALLETCMAIAETQEEDSTSTTHQQESRRLIQTAIRFDSGKTKSGTIGNLYRRNTQLYNTSGLLRDLDLTADVYAADR